MNLIYANVPTQQSSFLGENENYFRRVSSRPICSSCLKHHFGFLLKNLVRETQLTTDTNLLILTQRAISVVPVVWVTTCHFPGTSVRQLYKYHARSWHVIIVTIWSRSFCLVHKQCYAASSLCEEQQQCMMFVVRGGGRKTQESFSADQNPAVNSILE